MPPLSNTIMEFVENKYKAGEVVYERIRPNQKLVVRRSVGRVYYCMFPDDPKRKDLAFFERDIVGEEGAN